MELPAETTELRDIARALLDAADDLGRETRYEVKPGSPVAQILDAYQPKDEDRALLVEAFEVGTMYAAIADEQLPGLVASLSAHNLTGCLPPARTILELSARVFDLCDTRLSDTERIRRLVNEKLYSYWELSRFRITEDFEMNVQAWLDVGTRHGLETHAGQPPEVGYARRAAHVGERRPSIHTVLRQMVPESFTAVNQIYFEASAVHGTTHLVHLMRTANLAVKTGFHARVLFAIHAAMGMSYAVIGDMYGWQLDGFLQKHQIRSSRLGEIVSANAAERSAGSGPVIGNQSVENASSPSI